MIMIMIMITILLLLLLKPHRFSYLGGRLRSAAYIKRGPEIKHEAYCFCGQPEVLNIVEYGHERHGVSGHQPDIVISTVRDPMEVVVCDQLNGPLSLSSMTGNPSRCQCGTVEVVVTAGVTAPPLSCNLYHAPLYDSSTPWE